MTQLAAPETQEESTAAPWGTATLPCCVTHTFWPRDHFSHSPTLQIVEMTQLPCVTRDGADCTQRAACFKGNFTSPLLDVDLGKFLIGPGTRHFRDIKTQHSLNNMVCSAAMPPVLMERAGLKGGWSGTPVTARDCKASQDWPVPECTVLALPASILSRAQVFLGYAWAQVLSPALWKFSKQTKCCRQRSRFKESALQLCQQTLQREP